MDLQKIAMTAHPKISRWNGQKLDQEISNKVNSEMNAESDAGKYTKSLVSKSDLKPINKIGNQILTFHRNMTLPLSMSGRRLLPAKNYTTYKEGMDAFIEKFDQAKNEFIARYETIKDEARSRLGSMFQETEFPSVAQLDAKFGIDLIIEPIPDPEQFMAEIAPAELERLKTAYEQQLKASVNKAVGELYQRLFACIKRYSETLKDPDKRFKKTMITNLSELCEIIPNLNLTDDPVIANLSEKAKELLADINPDDLRDDKAYRATVAKTADELAEEMTCIRPGLRGIELD